MRKDHQFTTAEQVRIVLGLTLVAVAISIFAVGVVISLIPRI